MRGSEDASTSPLRILASSPRSSERLYHSRVDLQQELCRPGKPQLCRTIIGATKGAESMARLVGKTAIITGAASGIGRGTADVFAEHGARLVLADRDGPRLEVA